MVAKPNSDELKKILDALGSKYPGTSFESLREFEVQHEYVVTHGPDTYGRFKDQFKAFFQLANSLIIGLNYVDKKIWPVHRSLQFLFVIHNLRVLYSAVDRLLKGHWEDSLILSRVVLEAFGRIIWISCHPTRQEAGVIRTKDGKQFNMTNFFRDELKLDWHDYKFMSALSHGSQILVVKDWVALHRKEKSYPLQLVREFDKLYFELGVNMIVFLEVAYMRLITEVFVTAVSPPYLTEELLDDARKYARAKQDSMRTHMRDYWPKVADDIDRLIKLMQDCDKGGDYKTCWART